MSPTSIELISWEMESCQTRDLGQNHDFIEGLLFYSGENQNPKILKVVASSWGTVLLSSKVRAHKSLISDRKPNHKVRGYVRPMRIALYCLTR